MPQPGEIVRYKDYEFEDGSKGDKLFVVLNLVDARSPCLVLKTTSKSKRYADVERGCNPTKRVFFVPTDWASGFKLDTYIQLPQIIEISTQEFLQGHFSRKVDVIDSLSAGCLAKLKDCLKTFKRDISAQHWKLVFQS